MKPIVVDTNVLLVSEGRAVPQASAKCQAACDARLKDLQTRGLVVIDRGWLLLGEYTQKIELRKQSTAVAFLKWLMQGGPGSGRVSYVALTPTNAAKTDFAEYPDHPGLAKFDQSDRKFLAVAHAHQPHAAILNAVDTDWLSIRQPLADLGIALELVCADELYAIARGKGLDPDA